MNSDEKTLGKRIKGNLSKRWQGVKNIFGNHATDDAKNALQSLKTAADESYNKLSVFMVSGELETMVKDVWGALYTALTQVKKLCKTKPNPNATGRAFAAAVFTKTQIEKAKSTFNRTSLDNFNAFETQVEMLQVIANKTPMTSSLPSIIKTAARATSKFYAYAFAYSIGNGISSQAEAAEKYLKKNDSLWKRVKSIFSKKTADTRDQIKIDSNKVAKEIYADATKARIRAHLQTRSYMKYFGNCIKNFFGMWDSAADQINNQEGLEYLSSSLINIDMRCPSRTMISSYNEIKTKTIEEIKNKTGDGGETLLEAPAE